MKKQVVVGLDVGTSSMKVTAVDVESEKTIENFNFGYENMRYLQANVAYAEGYANAVLRALRTVNEKYQIAAIAVCTQMYSLCRQTPDGVVVYQWNCLWDRDRTLEDALRPRLIDSGCQNDVLFAAYKAACIKASGGTGTLPYGLKEYLLHYLTGNLATDYATASGSGLFMVKEKRWNLDFFDELGLDRSLAPDALRPQETVGTLRSGLLPNSGDNIRVVAGLGDGPSASYACKDVSNFCGNLGTSMAARVFTAEPDLTGNSGLWNYAVDEKMYLAGGISSNSCSVLNWAKENQLVNGWEELNSSGIQFFPWLHGERMPYWSSDLKGTAIGIEITDTKENLSAAMLKGVAFTFARMAITLEGLSNCGSELVLAGGGTNIPALVRVIAGCVSSKILRLEDAEYLCSTGAAMCAAENVGASLKHSSRISQTIEPTGEFREEFVNWNETAKIFSEFYNKRKTR